MTDVLKATLHCQHHDVFSESQADEELSPLRPSEAQTAAVAPTFPHTSEKVTVCWKPAKFLRA